MTIGIASRRKRPRWVALTVVVTALSLVATGIVMAGPVGTASGFEGDDGNLNPQSPINFDWNSFDPTTWSGTAPRRISSTTVNGWVFRGLEDAQAVTSDDAFAGGTKQDTDCASVGVGKAPNKDDLKRVYLSTKVVAGHTYLNLAWIRIPQNTTSPSAHIGFEFNKGSTPCPAGSNGLVRRSVGDMLIVYDFEGSSTDIPVLTLRRWVTSGACEISSNSAPCWGTATTLSAGTAEARVNTIATAADTISPVDETLGINEFGEASIDLTNAGVFTPGTCESFGKAFAVSRSSGNSGTAQMKDLVGPANFTIGSCATVIIRKVTSPSGDTTTNFGYTTNVTTSPATTTSPFSLKDGQSQTISNVVVGSGKTVTEDDPSPGYALTSINCAASTVPAANISTSTGTRTVTFSIAAGEILDCTFTNTKQNGAIKVTKTRKHAASGPGDHPHAGVSFTVNGVTKQTDANGVACFDGLTFGAAGTVYAVAESIPAGYSGTASKNVTVNNAANCSDTTYGGETVSFSNTPLTDITVSVSSQVTGGTNSKITCTGINPTPPDGTGSAFDDTSETYKDLPPGTYTCEIVVDP